MCKNFVANIYDYRITRKQRSRRGGGCSESRPQAPVFEVIRENSSGQGVLMHLLLLCSVIASIPDRYIYFVNEIGQTWCLWR